MVEKLSEKAVKVGFKPDNLQFIPASLIDGKNMVKERSPLTTWYKGPTLLEAAKAFNVSKKQALEPKYVAKPFNFMVSKVFYKDG
jgi:translation elongation factor EF-1alpha